MRQRVLAVMGALSMYRLVLFALVALALLALGFSFGGVITPTALEILASFAVLAATISLVDAVAQRLLRLPWRIESSLVTALILLFVLQPSLTVAGLAGNALAGTVASLSKYLIAWRGRHILNPAAFGAAIVTVFGLGSFSSWWVGSPARSVAVAVLGLLVRWRTETVRIVLVFLLVVVAVSVVRQAVQAQDAGFGFTLPVATFFAIAQTSELFLFALKLSEPLTLPPRRWQQFSVAALVGALAGWPIVIGGLFTLGQERALLIGNLLAFAFAVRGSVRLVLENRRMVTPTAQELTFRTRGRL